jgi:two-component system response regulator MprA
VADEFTKGDVAQQQRPRPRLLLVEDDVTSATRLSQLLAEDGYIIEWVSDARDATHRLGSGFRPDAILLDYKLPHGDGMVLARAARAQWPAVPVIFVTSYPEVVQREPPLDPPALLLSKPVAYDELLTALNSLLMGAQ